MWHQNQSDTGPALDSSIFWITAQVSAKWRATAGLGGRIFFRGGNSPATVKINGIAS
jgi:hypothetical protein